MDSWVIDQLIDWAAGRFEDDSTKEGLRRELSEVVSGFAGSSPTPVELVLAQTAAISWFAFRLYEAQYVSNATSEEGITLAESEHLQRMIDRAHRRLVTTLKALATVRRLAVPGVQIRDDLLGEADPRGCPDLS
jgi:hypothetical protein